MDAGRKVLEEARVRADGGFAVSRTHLGSELAWLEVTAVDHRQFETLIAVEPQPIELRIRMGTYDAPASLGDVYVVSYMGKFATDRVPMTRGADGRYFADVSTHTGLVRYQLEGVTNEGRIVNGTMSDSYEYDRGGDYISVLSAIAGTTRIIFDPKQRPLPGIETEIEFADPRSTNAQLYQVARALAMWRNYMQRTGGGETSSLHPKNSNALRHELERAGRSRSPIVRRAALLGTVAVGPNADVVALANKALAEIDPADPIWALEECAFNNVVRIAGGSRKNAGYVRAFVAAQPAAPAVGCYLMGQLTAEPAEPEAVRTALALLKGERFRNTPYAYVAERHDPDRRMAPGKQLPEFQVSALDGKGSYSPGRLRGKLYLIEMWASWCKPCVVEMPKIHEAFAKFGKQGKRKLFILSISIDESPEDVIKFRNESWPMPWEHALAKDSERHALRALFGGAVPFYALVDEQGKVLESSPALHAGSLATVLERLEQQ
jgi:thiol-disulfide isomerase/thioredoxin